jgi:hypothetical protein
MSQKEGELQVDLSKVKSEIDALTDEQLKEALLKLRVRQKVQQKKNYGSPKQKAYQLKQRERQRLLLALAREKGILDEIDTKADELAEERIAEDRAAEAAEE